ncbi:biotin--[acetyl-CoA-carboxylase] ligase [Anderseniella sp. Alg231-50]|uniref:biotin--[acetyl-CoA-carboxylase] ligase n=1 Tax=Anderseniella sp. Alg231-50 TaxID=1922226 RepID=UPI000D550D21
MSGSAGALPDIIWHDSVGSTNDEAHARLAVENRQPVWIAAAEQTSGKGRLGRSWVSKPGNLYASLTWPSDAEPGRLASLSLVAGLAVRDAVMLAGVAEPVQLKWPNDVLVGGKKISGILIETMARQDSHIAIVGCGINLLHHPGDTRWPATDLSACGVVIEPRAMLEHLRDAMHTRLRQWAEGAGLSSIHDDWMAAALGRGGRISVEGGKQGVFTGLSDDGALELTLDDGSLWTHHAGDVEWLEQRGSS